MKPSEKMSFEEFKERTDEKIVEVLNVLKTPTLDFNISMAAVTSVFGILLYDLPKDKQQEILDHTIKTTKQLLSTKTS